MHYVIIYRLKLLSNRGNRNQKIYFVPFFFFSKENKQIVDSFVYFYFLAFARLWTQKNSKSNFEHPMTYRFCNFHIVACTHISSLCNDLY